MGPSAAELVTEATGSHGGSTGKVRTDQHHRTQPGRRATILRKRDEGENSEQEEGGQQGYHPAMRGRDSDNRKKGDRS